MRHSPNDPTRLALSDPFHLHPNGLIPLVLRDQALLALAAAIPRLLSRVWADRCHGPLLTLRPAQDLTAHPDRTVVDEAGLDPILMLVRWDLLDLLDPQALRGKVQASHDPCNPVPDLLLKPIPVSCLLKGNTQAQDRLRRDSSETFIPSIRAKPFNLLRCVDFFMTFLSIEQEARCGLWASASYAASVFKETKCHAPAATVAIHGSRQMARMI